MLGYLLLGLGSDGPGPSWKRCVANGGFHAASSGIKLRCAGWSGSQHYTTGKFVADGTFDGCGLEAIGSGGDLEDYGGSRPFPSFRRRR
jgi:hypothetical protein